MAKKKNQLPQAFKNAAIGTGLRGAGAIAGAGMAHTVLPKMLADKPDNILMKQRGAVLVAIGIAAEAFLPDPMLQKVAQGISSYGVVQMANDNLPESMKATVQLETDGLSGIGAPLEVSIDWNALAAEAEANATPVSGYSSYRPSPAVSMSGTEAPVSNVAAYA